MSTRLIEIFLPEQHVAQLQEWLPRHCRRYWRESVPGTQEKFSCLVQSRYVERLLTDLERFFGAEDEFTVTVVTLEAVLPPIAETPETALPLQADEREPTKLEAFFSRDRISTNELYDDIEESLILKPGFLMMVAFSSVIAALGMRSGQTAVVIGAMIIAPLLGPAMGMAMAAVTGDRALGGKATAILAIGSALAIFAGFLVGISVAIDPNMPELRNRSIIHLADIFLALACGGAGVLALSKGASQTLVGVMIAVALVPPLSACGVFLGSGHSELAWRSMLLFFTNLVSINVAGILIFLLLGLPPKGWRITGGLLFVWIFLLLLLVSLITGRTLLELGQF